MSKLNTTNYNFLKNFRPELFKLAVKMEEDLLITPISMLAYSTRFLEYILYDIARLNDYKITGKYGLTDNIFEIIVCRLCEYYMQRTPIVPVGSTDYDHDILCRNGGKI